MSDTAESPPDDTAPDGTAPVDRRPRPQYGELAPEGWTWKPPTDAAALTEGAGTATNSTTLAAAPGTPGKAAKAAPRPKRTKSAAITRSQSAPTPVATQPAQMPQPITTGPPNNSLIRPVPVWDRYVTITLLGIGLLATFYAVLSLSQMPTAMQRLYTLQDLGTYEPAASVSITMLVGTMLQGLVWAATAALAVSRLVRGKRTIYVPIIGAVVSGAVLFGFMIVLLLTDPTLVSFFGRS